MAGRGLTVQPLTPEEKRVCSNLIVFGSEYLKRDLEWSYGEIKTFLDRKVVQNELDYLKELYLDREGHQERTRFFAQMKINSLVPSALAVLGKTLRGDKIKEDGKIDRAPTRAQYDAAREIMDRANIKADTFKETNTVPRVDGKTLEAGTGSMHGVSSERVSSFIEEIIAETSRRHKERTRRKAPPILEATVIERTDEVVDEDVSS